MRLNNLAYWLLLAIGITSLIPTTLLYGFGLIISIGPISISMSSSKPFESLPYLGVLFATGYSLFCLWWLLFSFRITTISQIVLPKKIGLGFGTIAALVIVGLFGSVFVKSPDLGGFITLLVMGLSPLLVLASILLLMRNRDKLESRSAELSE